MKIFWTCFAIDSLVLLAMLIFVVTGLGYGPITPGDIGLWSFLVGLPVAVLAGGLRLKATGRPGAATALLALMAVPGFLLGGYMLAILAMFAMHPGGHH